MTQSLPSNEDKQAEMANPANQDSPPEEGFWGWLCVAGSFISIFCTFGLLSAYVVST